MFGLGAFGTAAFGAVPVRPGSVFDLECADVLIVSDAISSTVVLHADVADVLTLADAVSATVVFSTHTVDVLNVADVADAVLDAVTGPEFTYPRFRGRLFYPAMPRSPGEGSDTRNQLSAASQRAALGVSESRPNVRPSYERPAILDTAEGRLSQSPLAPREAAVQAKRRWGIGPSSLAR